jgi:hypothetical protein
LAEVHSIKRRLLGDMDQPKTRLEHFRWPETDQELATSGDETKMKLPLIAEAPIVSVAPCIARTSE